jgi:hypothetical protein
MATPTPGQNAPPNSSTGRRDAALELVEEVRALENSGAALGAFDEQRVRQVVDRINQLDADLANVVSNPHVDLANPYYRTLPVYLQHAMLRDKRCLVTYLRWRLDSLSRLWWDSREHLAVATHATEAEAFFIRQYTNVKPSPNTQTADAPHRCHPIESRDRNSQ